MPHRRLAAARRRFILAVVLHAAAGTASAQPPATPLDRLVAEALRRNLGRRQQLAAVERADAVVRESRGRYLPSASINARYTELSGNTVNLGTLINPAFGALNQILQRPAFPTDIDLQLPLKQETTLRIAQPVFQPAILAAHRVTGALADAQGAERDVHARRLAADVRSGYLQYARLRALLGVYEATLPLLDEQLRVAERLVANGKATPDAILRARAERGEVEQRRDELAQGADAARASFNMLLDRPLETPLDLLPEEALGFDSLTPLAEARDLALRHREELRQLDHVKRATDAQERLAQGTFLPSVSVALDYGVQGNQYRFDRSRDFAALSVAVSWNLFNGGQDVARVQQAALDGRRVALQREEAERLVALEVMTAWQAADVARRAITTAGERLESARRSFELVRRRQLEGVATQLEFLDARAAYTSAATNRVATIYDYFLKRVALERASASYRLPESR